MTENGKPTENLRYKANAKAYLRLFMQRNEIIRKFDFSHKENQDVSLSQNNEDFKNSYFLLYNGLNLMAKADSEFGTKNLPNLFIEILLIKEKATSVFSKIEKQGNYTKQDVEMLTGCEKIITAASSFEAFSQGFFPKELSKEIIIEEANKRLPNNCQTNQDDKSSQLTTSDIIHIIAETEQETGNISHDNKAEYALLMDGIKEKLPSEIVTENEVQQPSQAPADNNQGQEDEFPTIKLPQDSAKSLEE